MRVFYSHLFLFAAVFSGGGNNVWLCVQVHAGTMLIMLVVDCMFDMWVSEEGNDENEQSNRLA
jgi:hypothetical protein